MRAIISGAGIAGLGLALCLRRRGHQALVLERGKGLRCGDYMIDFFGVGYEVAERLGLLPELEHIHCPMDRLVFLNSRGEERLSVPYPLLRQRLFGGRHFSFSRGDLQRLLFSHVVRHVSMRFGSTVAAVERRNGRVRARLSDGTELEADLLVGADGVHSEARREMLGQVEAEHSLGLTAAAYVLDEAPTALRRAKDVTMLEAPGRQLAVYPLRDGRVATFFLYHGLAQPATRIAAGPQELRSVYRDFGWIVPEVLERMPSPDQVYFDEVAQVEAETWSRGATVLVGDACHCVSLAAGSGASLALAGAYLLASEIGDTALDIPAALQRYERRMKPLVVARQATGRRLARWLVPRNAIQARVRDVALRAALWPGVSDMIRRETNAPLLAT